MLKKLLTGCLTIAAAAALAVPAMAADMSGKVGGRAVADLVSHSEKMVNINTGKAGESVSFTDMASEGRLDYTFTATEGDWTATGKIEFRSNSGDNAASTNPVILQKYIKLENDAFSAALGAQWWGFVYLTPYVGDSGQWDRYCYGCIDLRSDRLIVGIKNVGLQLMLKMDNGKGGTDTVISQGNTKNTSDSTDDTAAYDESEYGVQYNGSFGPVNVAAAYVTQSYKANKNQDATTKDTAKDGKTNTQLALAVQYAISEAMFAEFDYEAYTTKAGTSGAKEETQNTMGLAFSMAMSEVQGFTVAYDQSTYNDGKSGSKDVVTTRLTATFQQKIAGQKLWVGYNSLTKDYGISSWDKQTSSTLALGGRVSF